MSDASINASAESPANSTSSTRVSSCASYVPFPEPNLLSQPIPIPINQNNSTTGIPHQLSTGHTPYPQAPDVTNSFLPLFSTNCYGHPAPSRPSLYDLYWGKF